MNPKWSSSLNIKSEDTAGFQSVNTNSSNEFVQQLNQQTAQRNKTATTPVASEQMTFTTTETDLPENELHKTEATSTNKTNSAENAAMFKNQLTAKSNISATPKAAHTASQNTANMQDSMQFIGNMAKRIQHALQNNNREIMLQMKPEHLGFYADEIKNGR